jgi:serine/threonine protein kinase
MTEIEDAPDWNCLPGVTLDGGYELKEIIEADREQAIFRVRVLGDYALKASALFWPAEGHLARRLVEQWQSLRALQHKNDLRVPLGSGVLTLNGCPTAYVVEQDADETLADAIQKRPLSSEEATEMLRSIARGLEELHSNGLVHGCTAPSEVLAMGDSIKLTTEPIREVNSEPLLQQKVAKYLAPESEKNNVTIASDIWCLGATLFESLTQRTYVDTLREEAVGIKHPLGTILDACLEMDPDKRCKLSGLEAILRSKAPPPKSKITSQPVVAQVTEPARVLPVEVSESLPLRTATASVGSMAPAIAPIERKVQPPPESTGTVPEPSDSGAKLRQTGNSNRTFEFDLPSAEKQKTEANSVPRVSRGDVDRADDKPAAALAGRRGWLYAIAAFLVLFGVLWLVRSRSTPKTAAVSPAGEIAGTKPAWPTKTLDPDAKVPAPASPNASPKVTSTTADSPQGTWRVILYTYNREQDAQHKAQDINTRKPDLHAQVFAVNGTAGPYLVISGSQMSRDEAARVRARAMREGMPADTYIQNYNH